MGSKTGDIYKGIFTVALVANKFAKRTTEHIIDGIEHLGRKESLGGKDPVWTVQLDI